MLLRHTAAGVDSNGLHNVAPSGGADEFHAYLSNGRYAGVGRMLEIPRFMDKVLCCHLFEFSRQLRNAGQAELPAQPLHPVGGAAQLFFVGTDDEGSELPDGGESIILELGDRKHQTVVSDGVGELQERCPVYLGGGGCGTLVHGAVGVCHGDKSPLPSKGGCMVLADANLLEW